MDRLTSDAKRKKLFGSITIIVIVGTVIFLFMKKPALVTPLAPESGVKIIFVTPKPAIQSPSPVPSAAVSIKPSSVVKASPKATKVPAVSPQNTVSPATSANPTATPKPSSS